MSKEQHDAVVKLLQDLDAFENKSKESELIVK